MPTGERDGEFTMVNNNNTNNTAILEGYYIVNRLGGITVNGTHYDYGEIVTTEMFSAWALSKMIELTWIVSSDLGDFFHARIMSDAIPSIFVIDTPSYSTLAMFLDNLGYDLGTAWADCKARFGCDTYKCKCYASLYRLTY